MAWGEQVSIDVGKTGGNATSVLPDPDPKHIL
jgi:hypothetical protein